MFYEFKDIILREVHRLHQISKGFMNSGPSGFRSSLPFQGNLSEFPSVSWVYEGSRKVR